jgi:hemoglobin-like flavoprotein
MSIHFSKDSIFARADSGYYSPEKVTLLKRIFDNACNKARITEQHQRDFLAQKLLAAAKNFQDEAALTNLMKKSIANYRR